MRNYLERLANKIKGLSKYLKPLKIGLAQLFHQRVNAKHKMVKEETGNINNEVKELIEQGIDIPVFSKQSINILEHPFTKKIVQLLRYLAAEHDIQYSGDKLLFEILHFDFYKLPPIEIAKLTVEANGKKHHGELTSIRKLLYDKANRPPRDLFDTGIHPGLKSFSKTIEALIADVPNVTLQRLFENIICDAGVLAYIMKNDEKVKLIKLLTSFYDFIKRETSRNPMLNLQELISIIEVTDVKFRAEGKESEPSMFIAKILEAHELPVERIDMPKEELMAFEILNFTSLTPGIEKLGEDFISSLLNKYTMNVTSLSNYLNCPLQFYFKNLLQAPSGKSESTEFGSAVHFAIQRLFEKMQAHAQQRFPASEEMITDFKWYMICHRESFTREAFKRRTEYGEEVISNYYNKYISLWNKIVAVERTINNVVVRGVPIKGRIDKLEFVGNEINVVDYKTGNVNSKYTADKLCPPNDNQPNGGDYWRQAVFYKILVDNYDYKNWKVVSSEFDFIEPDKKKQFRKIKVNILPQDIETVTQQIIEVWKKIQTRDFYTGCGKENCHWCNFVKENKLAIALHELVEEKV